MIHPRPSAVGRTRHSTLIARRSPAGLRPHTAIAALLFAGCMHPLKLAKDDSKVVLARQEITAPDPSTKGPFAVRTLFYGSGTDKQRAIYRDSVTLKTKAVDGSKLASAPNPEQEKIRKKYWGFDFKAMPVNGRVWYPVGDGPFPLVLVVHGNHNMKDFSDPGYDYLGELLASRGIILASVDENFLNGFMRAENDARGWMLLKHLEVWRGFNDSSGTVFSKKVDMRNIALMGHSRGGEAVAVAGAFNRLKFYPDDATVPFNFNFDIKSLVAIAPIDGQYRPTEQPTPLSNVNYLVIHGSHDGDVSAFSGLKQYERIVFTDGNPWFKSAIYVYRANHGQWNSVWGNKDNGPRSARFLDLRGLITTEEQKRFGEVYISAFLEATLKGKKEYLPLFRDHRSAGQWLPKTMYITRFQDASFRMAADYNEDVDVTSGSVRGVTFTGDSLATWKEAPVPMRWRNETMGHNAAWLGWNNRIAGDDTTKMGRPASYALTISDSLRSAWSIDRNSAIAFNLAPTETKPGPRSPAKDTTKKADADSSKKVAAKPKPKPKKDAKPDTTAINLTVEAIDANNVVARVPLSRYGAIRRPLETHVLRRADQEKARFANQYEIVLQTFVIPMADMAIGTPGFDPARLTTVRLVFDRTLAGTVVVGNFGFARLDAGYFTNETAGRGR